MWARSSDRVHAPGFARLPLSSFRRGQRERHEAAVVGQRRAKEPAACRRNHDVLPAIFPEIRARRRLRGAAQLERPQLRSGLRIERAEPRIVGRADEHESSGGRNGSAIARPAGLLLLGEDSR